MKIIRNKLGWEEITTKRIKIITIWSDFQKDKSVKSWIESNKRIKMYKGWRKTCCCCKTPWEKKDGEIVFVQTTAGNKIICEKCWGEIK